MVYLRRNSTIGHIHGKQYPPEKAGQPDEHVDCVGGLMSVELAGPAALTAVAARPAVYGAEAPAALTVQPARGAQLPPRARRRAVVAVAARARRVRVARVVAVIKLQAGKGLALNQVG